MKLIWGDPRMYSADLKKYKNRLCTQCRKEVSGDQRVKQKGVFIATRCWFEPQMMSVSSLNIFSETKVFSNLYCLNIRLIYREILIFFSSTQLVDTTAIKYLGTLSTLKAGVRFWSKRGKKKRVAHLQKEVYTGASLKHFLNFM